MPRTYFHAQNSGSTISNSQTSSHISSSTRSVSLRVFYALTWKTDSHVRGRSKKPYHKANSGCSNLLSHLCWQRGDRVEIQGSNLLFLFQTQSFYSKYTLQIFLWLKIVFKNLMLLSFSVKDVLLRHVKVNGLRIKTLLNYAVLMTVCVDKKVLKILPDEFAFARDGWSSR